MRAQSGRAGVDVRFLGLFRPDHAVAFFAARYYWGELLAAGAEIYEYRPTMYHCKVMIVDGLLVSVGSFRLNDEATLNILDAALKQGIELPYSCKGGVCSTCRAKLIEGEVDMDVNFALEDYEIARGFILCCQSYPVTDTVVVDFDQVA